MRVRTNEANEANEAIDLEPTRGVDWMAIDNALRTIARRRGALDALEAKWIREALRVKIWREVGCVTMAEYLERRLGYAPRTAHDRVRVAVALEELPKLAAALEGGLPHSAVRELTRVCTNENEQKWLDKVRGKTVHEIEGMVSGRARGADPEDPRNPNLVGRTLPFEGIRPATEALVRDARRMLQEQRGGGEVLSDDEVLASFARIVLEGGGSMERTKAPYQIALTMCECCGRGWQDSGGRKYELSKADLERACCDAERIGRVDTGVPERAKQDVPPSTRRLVHRRARGRCEVPGCRSTRCLEIHHLVPRSLGGTHEPEMLILLCDGCHASHHRGLIQISGTALALVVTRKYEVAYDVPSNDEIDEIDEIDASDTAGVGTNGGHETDAGVTCFDAANANEPSAHVDTNGGHEIDAVVASFDVANANELSAHVGPNGGHETDAGVTCFDAANANEPSAHVGTNGGYETDAGVTCFDAANANEPSAHVGTNDSHEASRRGSHSIDEAPKAARVHEPSAHVGTNGGHERDCRGSHSTDEAPRAARVHEQSAHVRHETERSVDEVVARPSLERGARFERERIRCEARQALTCLGFRPGEAGKAVDFAICRGHETLEAVIREALRSCAPPSRAK